MRRDGTPFVADSSGKLLGRFAAGVTLPTTGAQGTQTQVVLDGWIFAASVKADSRGGHALSVSKPAENVRAAPNGRLLAQLVQGALLDSLERKGGWVHVRRSGWVRTSALRPATPEAAASVAAIEGGGGDSTQIAGVDPRLAVLRRRVDLFATPGTAPTGYLETGLPVRITARAGGWVRVQAEGWVRESEVRPPGGQPVSGVTAADIRTAPDLWQGKTVRWTIQYIALETADELRPDFQLGQRYILARGPAPEYAFVYVIVPPEQLQAVSALQPLDTLTVLAKVVKGRSTYLANPILELQDIVR